MYNHAKHEVSMICEDIKKNSSEFTSEASEYEYEESLKRADEHLFLKYIGLKLVLLHAYRISQLIEHAVFMFVKNGAKSSPVYYLTDLNIGSIGHSDSVWGIIINNAEEKLNKRMDKVLELNEDIRVRYAEL